jgi:TonB family protein
MKYLYKLSISVFLILTFCVLLLAQDKKSSSKTTFNKELIVIKAIAPVFSPAASATNTSGEVILEAKVNKDGIVTSVKILEGSRLLRKSAENAAMRWQFTPIENEENRLIPITFIFTIVSGDATAEELAPVFTLPYQIEVKNRPYKSFVLSDPQMDKP